MAFPLVKVCQLPLPDLWMLYPTALGRQRQGQHLADL
jgi:hypothetical protein